MRPDPLLDDLHHDLLHHDYPYGEHRARFTGEWWRSLAIVLVCSGASIGVLAAIMVGGA